MNLNLNSKVKNAFNFFFIFIDQNNDSNRNLIVWIQKIIWLFCRKKKVKGEFYLLKIRYDPDPGCFSRVGSDSGCFLVVRIRIGLFIEGRIRIQFFLVSRIRIRKLGFKFLRHKLFTKRIRRNICVLPVIPFIIF